jgi:hypothetical protein
MRFLISTMQFVRLTKNYQIKIKESQVYFNKKIKKLNNYKHNYNKKMEKLNLYYQ